MPCVLILFWFTVQVLASKLKKMKSNMLKSGKNSEKSKHATDFRGVCLICENASATNINCLMISLKWKLWYSSTIRLIHQT